jgi:hypothetical protein
MLPRAQDGIQMVILIGTVRDAKWFKSPKGNLTYVMGYCGGFKFTAVGYQAQAIMDATSNKMFCMSGPLKKDKEGYCCKAGTFDLLDVPGVLRLVSDMQAGPSAPTRSRVRVESETLTNYLATDNV